MTSPHLTLVHSTSDSPRVRVGPQIREARQAADGQVKALEDALLNVAYLSVEIARGGDVYPAGVREVCLKLAEDAVWKAQTLDAIRRQSRNGV